MRTAFIRAEIPIIVVACVFDFILYSQQRVAEGILTALKEHPESWTRVDTILEYSQNQQTKFVQLFAFAIFALGYW